ncbi:MAG: methyltransferase, partial [Deltaproteobacteria bacterium]|nr:methyltransferase [Deltaproteobacteria bacterium]
VATDLSERAIAYTRATALLCDRTIDARASDGAMAVQGERFDWIVCQPPFVPRPPSLAESTTYLHGGARGDELAWRLFRESAPLLAHGGTALFRLDLAGSPEEAAARIEAEVPTSSYLAFVCAGPSASELAMAYAAAHRASLDASVEADANAYAEAFEAAGITRMSGAIVVAWNGDPKVRAKRLVPSLSRVDARRIAIGRASIERATLPDPILARVTASVPEGAVLTSSTELTTRKSRIVLESPHASPIELSEPVALLIDVIAQGASLEEAAESLSRAIERSPDEALEATLRFARDALRNGLLEVAPD